MRWNEYDTRLRLLWNHITTAYSDTVSSSTSNKAEEEAFKLMEELTIELQQNKSNKENEI